MRIDIINNLGARSFGQELEQQMLSANTVDIATAFITKEAIELIKLFFERNRNRNKSARLITGFYNCFNSREVLEQLRDLTIKYGGRLKVNISRNQRFHWKYYSFERAENSTTYVGSANFTGSGMNNPGEVLSKMTLNRADKNVAANFLNNFNKEWLDSVPIGSVPLEKYKQSKQARSNFEALDPEIVKALSRQEGGKGISKEITSARVILLNDYLLKETDKIVLKYKSHWSKFNYFCYSVKSDFDAVLKADVLFIIEKYSGKYSCYLTVVEETDDFTTADGRYFIAHRKRNKTKRETHSLRNSLEEIGLDYHSRKFRPKTLGKRQTQKLINLFEK